MQMFRGKILQRSTSRQFHSPQKTAVAPKVYTIVLGPSDSSMSGAPSPHPPLGCPGTMGRKPTAPANRPSHSQLSKSTRPSGPNQVTPPPGSLPRTAHGTPFSVLVLFLPNLIMPSCFRQASCLQDSFRTFAGPRDSSFYRLPLY